MRRTLCTGEFHGHRRDTVRHAGLTLAEAEYDPGHRLPVHAHENPFFSLLLRGHFHESIGRRTRTCSPASLVFYPEHEGHGEEFGPAGGRSFNIELGARWRARLCAEGAGYPAGSRLTLHGRINELAARLHVAFTSGAPAVSFEEIVGEMLEEVGWTGAPAAERRPPRWLDRLRDEVHARFRERLTLGELAETAGVHPVYAARVFRRHHGCSIGAYVRTLRIEHARVQLADAERTLSSIAFDNGFADQAHFTRTFKATVGVPPGTYRRLVRAD